MSVILIGAIRLYQETLGIVLPRACRFEPTCSQYAVEAIRRHGAIRGTGLSVWRILRCNPWCRGGHDPVPLRGRRCEGMKVRGCDNEGVKA